MEAISIVHCKLWRILQQSRSSKNRQSVQLLLECIYSLKSANIELLVLHALNCFINISITSVTSITSITLIQTGSNVSICFNVFKNFNKFKEVTYLSSVTVNIHVSNSKIKIWDHNLYVTQKTSKHRVLELFKQSA